MAHWKRICLKYKAGVSNLFEPETTLINNGKEAEPLTFSKKKLRKNDTKYIIKNIRNQSVGTMVPKIEVIIRIG